MRQIASWIGIAQELLETRPDRVLPVERKARRTQKRVREFCRARRSAARSAAPPLVQPGRQQHRVIERASSRWKC
eukprot:421738-Pyramimonas_sp.AAC.1